MDKTATFLVGLLLAMPVLADGLGLPQIGDAPRANGFLPQVGAVTEDAGLTPDDTLREYIRAMQDRNDSPNLPVYSAASRLMLRNFDATDDQMRTVVETYDRCGDPETIERNGVAVQRFAHDLRQCPPVLMFREEGRWVLDLATSISAIRFNTENEWHFSGGIPKGYVFAFREWLFDDNGYPVALAPSDPSSQTEGQGSGSSY